MQETATDVYRCPACHAHPLRLAPGAVRDEREVRTGALTCPSCARTWAIEGGIVELLHDPVEHIVREAAGLDRFAERLRDEGIDREHLLTLPYVQDGYWYTQARSVEQVEADLPFAPGQRLLDVGSNTCWASARFARAGLDVVALDITTTLMQGLATADWWMDDGVPTFERALGSMTDMPFADGSFDVVFCCEVLHHNDRAELARTLREAHRVLRPGGRLIAINETLKTVRDRLGNHAEEIGTAEYEGHEHAYWAHEYLGAARRSGLSVRVLEPAYRPFFGAYGFTAPADAPSRLVAKQATRHVLQRIPAARKAYLAWVSTLAPRSSISFVGTKPG
jgi:SAM-dependent methyltransferase